MAARFLECCDGVWAGVWPLPGSGPGFQGLGLEPRAGGLGSEGFVSTRPPSGGLIGVGIWCFPLRDDRFLRIRRRAGMWSRKQQCPGQPVCLAPKRSQEAFCLPSPQIYTYPCQRRGAPDGGVVWRWRPWAGGSCCPCSPLGGGVLGPSAAAWGQVHGYGIKKLSQNSALAWRVSRHQRRYHNNPQANWSSPR